MTIGVAAEYTILVMERYAEEEERLHDPIAAIQESVQKIGTAITVSGLATFFGFSALCLATFPIISNFGIIDPDRCRVLPHGCNLHHAGRALPGGQSRRMAEKQKTINGLNNSALVKRA